jgi:gamma-D-glutamyl-L-lysine dipeptidyl-peptidase
MSLQVACQLAFLLFLAGTALPGRAQDAPPPPAPAEPGLAVAEAAQQQLGRPYRMAGDSPVGFDCSGLARFAHALLGIELPRTAREQRVGSLPLSREELQPGDLVFFTTGRRLLVNHVGVYLGEGRFVHAPRHGSPVRVAMLDEPWFKRRFAGGGRYWDPAGRVPDGP